MRKESRPLHQKELSLAVLMEKNENLISREKSLADNIEKLEFDKQRSLIVPCCKKRFAKE